MSILPLDSVLHSSLLGDPESAALMDERADIVAMIAVERVLAVVQGRLGIIPSAAARAIDSALARAELSPASLADGMGRDGVAAPALVAELRKSLPPEAEPWLHWGATSQDIADLSLLIRLKSVLAFLDQRLVSLMGQLITLANAHHETICLAHTRMQAAAPTLFSLRVAQWLAPLIRHRQRLAELRPRLLAVQFGGAAGNLGALGAHGMAVMDALADELGLARATPWHVARDRFEELGGVLAMIANSLGTIGLDCVLMAQSEIGEASFAGAGGSSTLPQKQNPVLAEVLQALARHAATLAGGLHQAGMQAGERDGAQWMLEWLTLPQLLVTVGASTLRAASMLAALQIDAKRMRANLEATNGLVLAEAVVFALATHMPRGEAASLVKKAVATSLSTQRHLVDILAEATAAPVDWAALRHPLGHLAPARQLAERILSEAENNLKSG